MPLISRHPVVGEQDGDPTAAQLDVAQRFEGLGSGAGTDDPIVLAVLPPEITGDCPRDRWVIVDGEQVGTTTGRLGGGVALRGIGAHCLHSAISVPMQIGLAPEP